MNVLWHVLEVVRHANTGDTLSVWIREFLYLWRICSILRASLFFQKKIMGILRCLYFPIGPSFKKPLLKRAPRVWQNLQTWVCSSDHLCRRRTLVSRPFPGCSLARAHLCDSPSRYKESALGNSLFWKVTLSSLSAAVGTQICWNTSQIEFTMIYLRYFRYR